MKENIVAAELLTCGICPLRCKYCYIPKTKEMKELHKEILKNLKTVFLTNLKTFYGARLKYLGFWGTEPATTFKEELEVVKEVLKFTPLQEVSFSTSFIFPVKDYLEFLIDLDKLNYPFKVKMQISLDGPEWITDVNRRKGATQIIVKNFKELVDKLNDIEFRNIRLDLHWKSTISIENMKLMNSNTHLIDEFFAFFEGLNDYFRRNNRNKRVFLKFGSYVPTLVVPGKYTVEDGKVFAEFLRNLHRKGKDSSYTFRLLRLLKNYRYMRIKSNSGTCSGGDSNFGVSDRILICHRLFYLNCDKYIESVLATDIENWDVSVFERGFINIIREKFSPKPDDEEEIIRFLYVLRSYHDFWRLKLASSEALVIELARANLVDKIFLESKELRLLLALFLHTGFSCPAENLLNTGNLYTPPTSLIKLWGNGAFQELVRHVLSRRTK